MLQKRYVIAFVIGCSILIMGAVFCGLVHRAVVKYLQEEFRKPENSPAVTPESQAMLARGEMPPDFGAELPRDLVGRVMLADLLKKFWFVWALLVYLGCFGVAHYWPKY